jgi:hypothetical protein
MIHITLLNLDTPDLVSITVLKATPRRLGGGPTPRRLGGGPTLSHHTGLKTMVSITSLIDDQSEKFCGRYVLR